MSELHQNFPQSAVIKMHEFVNFEGPKRLDNLLEKTNIPLNFDFLSIDIDGPDYHVWASLERYSPKVVCIEYNPSVPIDVEYVQDKAFGTSHGSSAHSLIKLGKDKNYDLVAVTQTNLIFVHSDFSRLVIDEALHTKEIGAFVFQPTYIFFGYDGEVLSNKESVKLPWHRVEVPFKGYQILPKGLRQYSQNYNLIQKLWLKIFRYYLRMKCGKI